MLQLTPLKVELFLGLIIVLLLVLIYWIHTQRVIERPQENSGLGIEQVLTQVKSELNAASAKEKDMTPMFDVKSFDLELNFIVRKGESGTAGVKTEVVSIGGGTESSSETVQKIRLHMEPVVTDKREGGKPTGVPSSSPPIPLTSPPPGTEDK